MSQEILCNKKVLYNPTVKTKFSEFGFSHHTQLNTYGNKFEWVLKKVIKWSSNNSEQKN